MGMSEILGEREKRPLSQQEVSASRVKKAIEHTIANIDQSINAYESQWQRAQINIDCLNNQKVDMEAFLEILTQK